MLVGRGYSGPEGWMVVLCTCQQKSDSVSRYYDLHGSSVSVSFVSLTIFCCTDST